MSHNLFLSSADPTPMYQQIMARILEKILVGDWPPGQALPSIRELASDNNISVITVKRAYLELERDQVIVTRQGKGSFVAEGAQPAHNMAKREFDSHLEKLLEAARKMQLNQKQIIEQIQLAMNDSESSKDKK